MKTSHTPPTWLINTMHDTGLLITDSKGDPICEMIWDDDEPFESNFHDEQKANAKFICLAVNCHDVLLRACEEVMTWAKTPGNHGGNPYILEFVKLAEVAIAKAGGAE